MKIFYPSVSNNAREYVNHPYFNFINELKLSETQTMIYRIFGGLFQRTLCCQFCQNDKKGENENNLNKDNKEIENNVDLNGSMQFSSNTELFLTLNLNFPLNIYFRSKEQPFILHKLVYYSSNAADIKENDLKDFICAKFQKVKADFLKIHFYDIIDEIEEKQSSSSFYESNSSNFYGSNSQTMYPNSRKSHKKPSSKCLIFVIEMNDQEMQDTQNKEDVLFCIMNKGKPEKKNEILTFVLGNCRMAYGQLYLEIYSRIREKEVSSLKEDFKKEFLSNDLINEDKALFLLDILSEKDGTENFYNSNKRGPKKLDIYQSICKESDIHRRENDNRVIEIEIFFQDDVKFPKISKQIRISDFLELFLHSEKIMEKTCEKCSKPLIKTTKIQIAPNILILVLGRFYHDVLNGKMNKNNIPITIEERISLAIECPNLNFDLSKTNFNENSSPKKVEYELIGISTHYGQDLYQGHYISYCWDSLKRTWFICDDHTIDEMSIERACKENDGAYIIFYRKMKIV